MRAPIPALLVILIISGYFLSSCSSNPPVNPDQNSLSGNFSQVPVWVSEWDEDGNPFVGQGLLGVFTINVDTDPLDVRLNPIRHASVVDSMEVLDIS